MYMQNRRCAQKSVAVATLSNATTTEESVKQQGGQTCPQYYCASIITNIAFVVDRNVWSSPAYRIC